LTEAAYGWNGGLAQFVAIVGAPKGDVAGRARPT
jgi:hypothetical protein